MYHFLLSMAALAANTLIILGAYFLVDSLATSRHLDLAEIKEHLSHLNSTNAQLINLLLQKKYAKQYQLYIKEVDEKNHLLLRIFPAISATIPQKTWLSQIKKEDDLIVMEGSTLMREDLNAFIHALKSTQFFSSIELKQIKKEILLDKEVYSFHLLCWLGAQSG